VTTLYTRTLFWSPRLLGMVYVGFLGLFALDVFGEEHGFWRILAALSIHLIPAFVVAAGLILAWRREWVGAIFFAAAGTFYSIRVLTLRIPAATKITWIGAIAGPSFLVAALFLANWLERKKLHPNGL